MLDKTNLLKIQGAYKYIYVLGAVFFIYTIIVVPKIEPQWDTYPDVNDYIKQSTANLLREEMFFQVF